MPKNQQQQSPRLPDYVRYNQLKRDWIAENPKASDREWNAAMREFARICGV